MISQEHRNVLRAIHERLMDLDSPWAITGSLGFALQGLESPVNDIDLQTNQDGAYKIQNVFGDQVIRNVAFSEAKTVRSHFGELKILGVTVEVIGAMQKRLPTGEWESPVDVQQHRTFVEFDAMKLPVLSLDYEEQAYRILGRIDKADMIKQWLVAKQLTRAKHGNRER